MSLQVSFNSFQKMTEKECLKQTGLSLEDFPTIFCEDFWPVDYNAEISVQDAKEAVENFLKAAINTL